MKATENEKNHQNWLQKLIFFDNQAFVQDLPQNLKVEDIKTKLESWTVLKNW